MPTSLYLDYNATSPLRPEAKAAMAKAMDMVGNPSSIHTFGRAARQMVEEARAQVAALVGAAPVQVIFTSSGTEANVMALHGFPSRSILISAIEHDSVRRAAQNATVIPVAPEGIVDLNALEQLLKITTAPALVSIMAVNNETGVIQPIKEAAQLARTHGALIHTDAIQAAGRFPFTLKDWNVDLLSLSAHKLGGPTGVGALIIREDLDIAPLLKGGGQERRRRAGTENIIGIAGFGAAATAADFKAFNQLSTLRDRLETQILNQVPTTHIYGNKVPRVANTTCLSMPSVPSEKQVIAFDLAGIAVSAGSACSSGKVQASHVLKAMGVPELEAATAIRVSFGPSTTIKDIDRFVATWLEIYKKTEKILILRR